MITYADNTFYTGTYLSGKEAVIDTASFNFYARQASQVIRRFTFGNIIETDPIIDEVKMCCCELAEHLFNVNIQLKRKGKLSESTADHSESYINPIEIRVNGDADSYAIMQNWLLNTGLMYRGCY